MQRGALTDSADSAPALALSIQRSGLPDGNKTIQNTQTAFSDAHHATVVDTSHPNIDARRAWVPRQYGRTQDQGRRFQRRRTRRAGLQGARQQMPANIRLS